jgi:hypothetical protein
MTPGIVISMTSTVQMSIQAVSPLLKVGAGVADLVMAGLTTAGNTVGLLCAVGADAVMGVVGDTVCALVPPQVSAKANTKALCRAHVFKVCMLPRFCNDETNNRFLIF